MKIKNLKARMAGKSVVLSLTGFIELGKEYIVREAEIKGKKVVLIYEPDITSCDMCGKDVSEPMIENGSTVCDECLSGVN